MFVSARWASCAASVCFSLLQSASCISWWQWNAWWRTVSMCCHIIFLTLIKRNRLIIQFIIPRTHTHTVTVTVMLTDLQKGGSSIEARFHVIRIRLQVFKGEAVIFFSFFPLLDSAFILKSVSISPPQPITYRSTSSASAAQNPTCEIVRFLLFSPFGWCVLADIHFEPSFISLWAPCLSCSYLCEVGGESIWGRTHGQLVMAPPGVLLT